MQLDPSWYDVEADPHYYGPTREEREEQQSLFERAQYEVEARAQYLRAVREVTGHTNWPLVEAMLQRDLDRVREAQGAATDQLLFRELKGKAEALSILLALPLKIEQSLRGVLDEADSLRAIEGGVEE